jgi:uncharacterized protein (DUF4415 family)
MMDKTDWKRVSALTDADIAKAVDTDPDTFVPDADWMAKAQLVMPRAKKIVTLRLDPDVLEWFMQAGRGYQTRINAVLKAFVEAQEHRPR